MLQTMCKLELKRRSYGRLKTTASSCAKISQLRNRLRNHLQAANEVVNHLQVAESSPSCEITYKLQNQSSNLQNG